MVRHSRKVYIICKVVLRRVGRQGEAPVRPLAVFVSGGSFWLLC